MSFTAHLRAWHEEMRGYRSILLAAVFSLPDILDGLAGVDLSPLLPPGWGLKVGLAITVARIVAHPIIERSRRPVASAGDPA